MYLSAFSLVIKMLLNGRKKRRTAKAAVVEENAAPTAGETAAEEAGELAQETPDAAETPPEGEKPTEDAAGENGGEAK